MLPPRDTLYIFPQGTSPSCTLHMACWLRAQYLNVIQTLERLPQGVAGELATVAPNEGCEYNSTSDSDSMWIEVLTERARKLADLIRGLLNRFLDSLWYGSTHGSVRLLGSPDSITVRVTLLTTAP